MSYDKNWPDAQRIRVAVEMIKAIQADIPAGRYSEPGRVNCQATLYILILPADELDKAMVDAPEYVRKAAGFPWGN